MLGKSLHEIDQMEADEILQWQEWLTTEPRHFRRLDYLAAQITQAVYTVLTSFGGGKEIKFEDCLLKFENKQTDPDKATVKNVMMIGRMFGKDGIPGMPNLLEKIKEIDSQNKGN